MVDFVINPMLGLLIFVIILFILTFLILRITKNIKVNRIIISLLLILNILFLKSDIFYSYGFYTKLSIILITNYTIFILYFFSNNKDLSIKEILKKNEYKMNLAFLASYIIIFTLSYTLFESGLEYAEIDLACICLLYLIRVYSYIYIHSFAQQIKKVKPEWITQFNLMYELAKEREKKELMVWCI